MKLTLTLHHKHETVPVKRPLPFMGKHVVDAETGERVEHPNIEEFKAQVEEDLAWAFGVARKAVHPEENEGEQGGHREGSYIAGHRETINIAAFAAEVFHELRRLRWNTEPGPSSKDGYVDLLVTLKERIREQRQNLRNAEAAAEGDEPTDLREHANADRNPALSIDGDKPAEAPEGWEDDAGESESEPRGAA